MYMLHLENYRLDTEYENQLIIKVTLVCITLHVLTIINIMYKNVLLTYELNF